jgi:hypothetical protein
MDNLEVPVGTINRNGVIAIILLVACAKFGFGQSLRTGFGQTYLNEAVGVADIADSGTGTDSNTANVPDAPSAGVNAKDGNASATASPVRKNSEGAPPAALGPQWNEVKQVADLEYWEVTGSLFAASVANAELAQRCLEQAACAWVPTPLRSRTAMYGIGIPADLALSYFTYRLKRNRKSFWFLPSTLATGLNGYAAIHDFLRLH